MYKTIMTVDDSASIREMIASCLQEAGYRVVGAENGAQALDLVMQEKPEVILLDIVMPQMNGFEVLQHLKIREYCKLIPVIMVSSEQDVDKRVKAFEMGADDFLIKPVEEIELLARVRSLIKVKAFHDHVLEYQKELESKVKDKTRQLQQALEKVKNTSLEVIFRLCSAAEYRDEQTGNHIWRLGRYASAIAEALGLDHKLVESIYYAAPMHDVGKIGIPDSILLKPGPLDPGEWKIMKTHTTIGGQILKGSSLDIMRMAEVIALTHHEKWNGSGYPKGLQKEEIPISGRITAIADVFDALTSKRPYKEVFSLEKALGIIKDEEGKHFDPRVVEAFFSVKDEILYIHTFEQDAIMKSNYRQELSSVG